MSIEFVKALTYPFQRHNWMNTLIIPGGVYGGMFVILLVFGIILGIAFYGSGMMSESGDLPEAAKAILDILNFIISIPLSILTYGYMWVLWRRIQETGSLDVEAPSWTAQFKQIVKSGAALFLYFLVLTILMMIIIVPLIIVGAIIGGTGGMSEDLILVLIILLVLAFLAGMFFLMPFYMAPVAVSAKSGLLMDLTNVKAAWHEATSNYWNVLLSALMYIGAAIIWCIGLLMVCLTIIGILVTPFLFFSIQVISFHLFAQGFRLGATPSSSTETPVSA